LYTSSDCFWCFVFIPCMCCSHFSQSPSAVVHNKSRRNLTCAASNLTLLKPSVPPDLPISKPPFCIYGSCVWFSA
jgi:hypothetical protein